MRIILLLGVLFLSQYKQVNARGIKIYVGSAEKQKTQSTRHYIQFILCNNLRDTIFVKRSDLELLYPQVTTDASEISNSGTYYLVNNATSIIKDDKRLNELAIEVGKESFDNTLKKEKQQHIENNELPQQKIGEESYYRIAPNKCLTINNLSYIALKEVLKLHDISSKEKENMEVYYTTKIEYLKSKDKVKRQELLIARPSEDLKKILLEGHIKSE